MNTLILGATGFIGSYLLKDFIKRDVPLSVLVRDPSKLVKTTPQVQVYQGDLQRPDSLKEAIESADIIYYLVHAMGSKGDYEDLEKTQAENVVSFLKSGQKVIYLSGLAHGDLSKHMRSRQQVGDILRSSEATIIEFRASIVIGAGSTSFDMMSAIVSRFPVILDTTWARTLCQPISINNLLEFLILAQDLPQSEVIEIGGPTELTYVELLKLCADLKEVKRPVLKIDAFPKEIVIKAMEIFLPEHYEVGKKLFSSIELASVVEKKSNLRLNKLESLEDAIKNSLKKNEKIKQVSIEELMSYAQSSNIKRQLSDMELIENFDFSIPISFSIAKNLTSKFISLIKFAPFKTYEVVGEEDTESLFKFNINNVKGPKFELVVTMTPNDHHTQLKILTRYHATGFIDSASYAAFRSFSEKWIGRIKTVFGQ